MLLPIVGAADGFSASALLVVYCVLVLLASLLGGLIPLLLTLTHRLMQLAVSFVAGMMLGVGVLHMLAHALRDAPANGVPIERVLLWMLVGLLVMFFVERFFRYHHHDVPAQAEPAEAAHDPAGAPPHADDHEPALDNGHNLNWGGAALGLTLHSVINGVALAAAVQAEWGIAGRLAGLATFLVIFLHKPFDSLTLGTLMAKGGWPAPWRHTVNGLFALAIPLGAAAFYLGADVSEGGGALLIYALAFSAGAFLCISLSDLLPELQFHHHDRIKLSLCLLAGLALAYVVGVIETHEHSPTGSHPGHVYQEQHLHPD